METAVTAPALQIHPGSGRSNGVQPSLSSTSDISLCCRAARRCRSPTQLHGLVHVRRALLPGGSCIKSIPPAALTWNYVKVLTSTSPCSVQRALPVASGDALPPRTERATNGVGPCLTLGRFVSVFLRPRRSTPGTLAS